MNYVSLRQIHSSFTTSIFGNSHWDGMYMSRGTTTIARKGVSLLLWIGNPAKRERALTSAYKLLVDISSVTSLPAMCRLVSAVWWMVPPAPPISLLSSRPSRQALPQIVAHKRTQAQNHRTYTYTLHMCYIYICIYTMVYEGKRIKSNEIPYKRAAPVQPRISFLPIFFFARSTIFSRDI